MYSPIPDIGFPSLHILHIQLISARYLHIGVKCRDRSDSPLLAMAIARSSSRFYLGCDMQALRSTTSNLPTPTGLHAKAYAI